MSVDYLDFTDETFPLIQELIVSCFGKGALSSLQKILDNPARKMFAPAGCIGLKNGKAVCFKASMVRRLYFGQEELFGLVGGYFCKTQKGCPLSIVLEVQERSEWDHYPCRLRFGNTCIYLTMRMNAELGAHQGPESWTEMRFGIIRPIRFLWLLFRRKALHLPQPVSRQIRPAADDTETYAASGECSVRRIMNIDSRFEDFWKRYLSKNRSIVASRDLETLAWLFGKEVKNGKDILLALVRNSREVEGFIVLRRMAGSPDRWQIMDMIALENDPSRLDLLLAGTRKFLKRETSAITLESTGFPDFIQPVLSKHMPHLQKTGHNRFEWISKDPEVIQLIEQSGNSRDSWFFGPFDGDYIF